MKLLKNMRWTVIAASLVSGPALAATINCSLTPVNSVITVGETLQLAATCEGGPLQSINWMQGSTSLQGGQLASLTGPVLLSGDTSKPIYFTTPAAVDGDYIFTVSGVPLNATEDTFGASSEARVQIKATAAAFGTSTAPSSPTLPVNAACGSAAINGSAVQSMPTSGQQCDLSKGKPALVISGPTSFSWSCISLTGGAEASCYVPRGVVYLVTPSVVGSGTISPQGVQTVNSNSNTSFTVTPNSGFNIASVTGCSGSLAGSTYTTGAIAGNCSVVATFAVPQLTYTVTASAGAGGTINPSGPITLNANATRSYTVTANNGYTLAGVTGCNGSLTGNTYNTAGITSNCNVSASFSANPAPPPPSDGSDPRSGSWWPTSNRLIADQTGTAAEKVSYLPGCLNGATASSASSGCAAAATNQGFNFSAGKVLGIRYVSKPTLSTVVRYFKINSGYGGSVGPGLRAWLSSNPAATLESVPTGCTSTTGSSPVLATGGQYCQIQPNTLYYLFMTDTAGEAGRYTVSEVSADFN